MRRRWILREPVTVTYFIRRAKYNREPGVEGAPAEEQTAEALTVGSYGTYEVMHRLVANQSVRIESIRLEPHGPIHVPENLGRTEPMEVSRRGGPSGDEWMDWHGIWHQARTYPIPLPKGEALVLGHRIHTGPEWTGSLTLYITLQAEESRASTTYVKTFPFSVGSEDQDQLRFMRDLR